MTPVIVTLAFLAVFAMSVIVLTVRNARKHDELMRLNAKVQGAQMLRHAIEYLTPMGMGANLEWTNARAILEYALASLIFG